MVLINGCLRGRAAFLLSALLALPFFWFFLTGRMNPQYYADPVTDPSYGRLAQSPSLQYAFATFLDDSSGDGEDLYYAAARILTYSILHANETKLRTPAPFIVLVTPGVAKHKRAQLTLDGATVIEAEDIKLPWWIFSTVSRWKNQFSKLRLLQLVQYDRIVFIDADHLIMRRLDPIMTDPATRTRDTMLYARKGELRGDEAPVPAQFVFAARSDNMFGGKRAHPVPPPSGDDFSAGFWVAAPSQALFEYLLSVIKHPLRFTPQQMEQSLFNYAFRRDGAMPWQELNYIWCATYPNEADYAAGVVALHEKFWLGRGPQVLQDLWWERKAEMEMFFAERQSG